ncbi:monooxygenase [Actinomycetospora straminea]|uniref:FAD binding domain-containing protein n=1 Tax=Actinomycetospora straminea TaxID=663607 RepID=UPI002366EA94|nr:monooxygenase [Actinomycetospora straminea]MDD7933766.1 monooxygenase [Actinomycetospora straminea]
MGSNPRVAVVGGSIGGLTAGLLLGDLGCDVHIYERSRSELDARGAGIAVLDATIRYFRERTAVDPDTFCSRTGWIRYLWSDGSRRYQAEHHYRFSSWNAIYRELLRIFDAERYHLGREMTSFRQLHEGVEITFADGARDECDLLVAADGINSLTRETLFPSARSRYSGYVAYRGTVPEEDLRPETFAELRDAITYQVIRDSHVLVYPIPGPGGAVQPGERLSNYVWYRNVAPGAPFDRLLAGRDGQPRKVSVPPGMLSDEAIEEFRATATRELAPPIAEVVNGAREPFVQAVYDIDVPAMTAGQVAILGDAAFAVRPHAAAGTAKAAADAWALADALEGAGGDIPAALKTWEEAQLDLGRRLLERCREIGRRSQVDNSWDPSDPYLIFGLHEPGR